MIPSFKVFMKKYLPKLIYIHRYMTEDYDTYIFFNILKTLLPLYDLLHGRLLIVYFFFYHRFV